MLPEGPAPSPLPVRAQAEGLEMMGVNTSPEPWAHRPTLSQGRQTHTAAFEPLGSFWLEMNVTAAGGKARGTAWRRGCCSLIWRRTQSGPGGGLAGGVAGIVEQKAVCLEFLRLERMNPGAARTRMNMWPLPL